MGESDTGKCIECGELIYPDQRTVLTLDGSVHRGSCLDIYTDKLNNDHGRC